MAFDKESFVYGVKDCKVAKLTADAQGGAATYDSVVDVPGIKSVGVSFAVDEKELRGDEIIIDSRAKISSVELSVEHAVVDQDVLVVLLGGAATSSGTTPNIVKFFDLEGADRPNYFKLEAQVVDIDDESADAHFITWKAKLSGNLEMGAEGEDYKTVSFTAKGIPRLSDDKMFQLKFNETETAIT